MVGSRSIVCTTLLCILLSYLGFSDSSSKQIQPYNALEQTENDFIHFFSSGFLSSLSFRTFTLRVLESLNNPSP